MLSKHDPNKYNIRLTEEELKFINDLISKVKPENLPTVISKKWHQDSKKPRFTVLITKDRKCFLIGDGERTIEGSRKEGLETEYVQEKNAFLGKGSAARVKASAMLIGEEGISNELFAVKIFRRNKNGAENEANLFNKANGYAEYIDGGTFSSGYIVEDFIPGVEFSQIEFSNTSTPSECTDIILAGLREIARLHQLNICQGDGDGMNLKYDPDTKTARFIDFGYAYQPNENRPFEEAATIGTLIDIFRKYIESRNQTTMANVSSEYLRSSTDRLESLITSFVDSKTGKLDLDEKAEDQIYDAINKEIKEIEKEFQLNRNVDDTTLQVQPALQAETNREQANDVSESTQSQVTTSITRMNVNSDSSAASHLYSFFNSNNNQTTPANNQATSSADGTDYKEKFGIVMEALKSYANPNFKEKNPDIHSYANLLKDAIENCQNTDDVSKIKEILDATTKALKLDDKPKLQLNIFKMSVISTANQIVDRLLNSGKKLEI